MGMNTYVQEIQSVDINNEPVTLEDGSKAVATKSPDGTKLTDGGTSYGSFVLECDNTITDPPVAPEFVTGLNAKAIYINDIDFSADTDLLIGWSTTDNDEGVIRALLNSYATDLGTPTGTVKYNGCARFKAYTDGTRFFRNFDGPLLLAQAVFDTDLIQTVVIRSLGAATVTISLGVSQ